jgi:hypothetical protein
MIALPFHQYERNHRIWGSHSGGYEEIYLQGYNAV